jgi:hypothetical protein
MAFMTQSGRGCWTMTRHLACGTVDKPGDKKPLAVDSQIRGVTGVFQKSLASREAVPQNSTPRPIIFFTVCCKFFTENGFKSAFQPETRII